MPPQLSRTSRAIPCLLVLAGREQIHWPELLESALAKGALQICCIESLHDAAANFVLLGAPCAGMLVDARWLSSRELQMVSVIKRHTSLPIWMLPETAPDKVASPRETVRSNSVLHRALSAGILPWEHAAQSLAQFLQQGYTPIPAQGNRTAFSPPDNVRQKHSEIPVATHLATSYHAGEERLLSPAEIQALLGTAD